jgi:nascent polypeptide-associated complex subunit alpha
MFGMGGLDPKKMQAVMKQMGISQQDIPASKVIIEKLDNTKIIIDNPSVTKINMQGQNSFQISGDIREGTGESEDEENEDEIEISKKDIETVMEKTGCSKKEAIEALEETGDLAEAILKLSE